MGHIDEDDIVRRLHSLGEQPIEPGVVQRHTSALGGASFRPARNRRRPAVTAAFVAGILLGGTGLAAAGPGDVASQASDVARSALAKVNLVDDGPKTAAQEAEKAAAKAARAQAKAARIAAHGGDHGVERFTAGCTVGTSTPPTPFVGNHGQYVKAHPDDPGTTQNERQMAAESDCGKPCVSLENPTGPCAAAVAAKAPKTNSADDADKGRPASPGKSEESHPSSTAGATAESDGPGKAGEHRPEGVGPTSTSSSTP